MMHLNIYKRKIITLQQRFYSDFFYEQLNPNDVLNASNQ